MARSRCGGSAAGTRDRIEPDRLGRLTPLALAGAGLLVAIAVGVPMLSLAHWLLVGSSTEFPIDELVSATVTTTAWRWEPRP